MTTYTNREKCLKISATVSIAFVNVVYLSNVTIEFRVAFVFTSDDYRYALLFHKIQAFEHLRIVRNTSS